MLQSYGRNLRTLEAAVKNHPPVERDELDNYDLAAMSLPAIKDIPTVQVTNWHIDPYQIEIRANVPTQGYDIAQYRQRFGRDRFFATEEQDIVTTAVHLRSAFRGWADTRTGSLNVEQYAYRLVCSNGQMEPDEIDRTRIDLPATEGVPHDDYVTLYAADIGERVYDAVKAACDWAKTERTVHTLALLGDTRSLARPQDAVERFTEQASLTPIERECLRVRLALVGDMTQFGFVQAITNMAQYVGAARRVELERLGGEVARMGEENWEALATA